MMCRESFIVISGACPLEKLYAALEKLKGEEYLRHPEFVLANKEKLHAGATNARVSMGNHVSKTTTARKPPSAGVFFGLNGIKSRDSETSAF